MAYTEPKSAFGGLSLDAASQKNLVVLRDENGLSLEVGHIEDAGWWLEVRYDEIDNGVKRQPLTGDQERCTLQPLQAERVESHAHIHAGEEFLSISLTDGAFCLAGGPREFFRSNAAPFRSHRDPIDVSEGVASLRITNFVPGEFLTPYGATFRTRMSRFQFPRPAGVVLGLPGQAGEFNRNGYRFELYNTDEGSHIPDRRALYQSWPILIYQSEVGEWVGIFHDNPSRTFVDVGDFYPYATTFESVVGNTRVFIVHASDIPGVTKKLSKIMGHSVFPPAWAFGYQQCRWSYTSTQEAERVAARMREERMPCDAIYFDIHFMDGYRVFTTDPRNFTDLKECIERLHEQKFKTVCIVDPGVKIDDNFPLYKNLLESKAYLTKDDGSAFQGTVWPGRCIFPDYSNAAAQELWSDTQCAWYQEFKVDGVWNDMNEIANFDGRNASSIHAHTSRGPIANEWNLYGYRMAAASALGWEKFAPGKRALVISRSGYAGMQRYAVNWHGDNHAWWEHLRLAIDTTIGYSLCGALYTGADVPGFSGNPSDDLAVRFFQLGAFLPLFRGHSIFFARDKEPYAYGPENSDIIRSAIELRYSLMREWYSGFEFASRNGLPIHLPVLTDKGNVARDQFLLFEKFLVAPVVERDAELRPVFLPPGRWYRLGNTNDVIEGNRWIFEPVTLSSIPVFVREGSIVVRNSVAQTVAETLNLPEQFEVYADSNGASSGYWYKDDLESIDGPAERYALTANGQNVERAKL